MTTEQPSFTMLYTPTEPRRIRMPFGVGLLVILIAALLLRTYALDWDAGTHLHPDERYLTMVSAALEPPATLREYWDTAHSSFNPANRGQPDYVYGTLPLFVTRLLGEAIDQACGETPLASATWLRMALLGTNAPCWPGTYTGYAGIHLVGRVLSALADSVTLLALAIMAYTLYNKRVALLAALLYAFAPLPIQHAHFFVVDSFATVFTAVTLMLLTIAVRRHRSGLFLVAGFTTGLALACKVSVWPLAGMVALASVVSYDEKSARYRFGLTKQRLLWLGGAGLLALIAFRCGQPYAFMGPGFFGLKLNARWLELMRYIRLLMSGAIDTPPGHQWTDRAPLLFPWVNITFWGLGLPVALAAWMGWAVLTWQLLSRRDGTSLLPWVWTTGLFFYIGTQWVKSMRYFLPIYPTLVLFAAWWLWHLQKERGWWRRALLLGTSIGGVAWGLAFMSIYRQPVTRITASQWMFEHIPTALTAYDLNDKPLQIPFKPDTTLHVGETVQELFIPERDLTLYRVSLNKVRSADFSAGRRWLKVRLTVDAEGRQPLAEAEQVVVVPATGTAQVEFTLPVITLRAQQPVYIQITLFDGAPLVIQTSVLGNEHWDDTLPLRIDAKDPYWNWYRGLATSSDGLMDMYFEDTAEKRGMMLEWLDEVDYIVLSSNRLYASIPRLPQRYPMTTAYYRALFDGSLGFELLADFVSFPRIGPCQFNDQESPFRIPPARYTNAAPCTIPYPPAEEAFSVYDHPRVLIFAKTAAYSRAKAESILDPALLDHVVWTTPREASRARGQQAERLLLDAKLRAAQESGGTWSRLFNRQALQNRSPLIAVVLWWLMLALLGIIAYPWVRAALPNLEPYTYGLAKVVGLLVWAYVGWLFSALRWVPHTPLWLATVGVTLAALAVLAYARDWPLWKTVWHTQRRDLFIIEMIFTGLYAAWVVYRWHIPDLWQPFVGGEKPMDFAYLNAVVKSTYFPPYDPWFAGGVMNYYYFGFVLVASLIKVTGIVPSIAYNLAIPTFFALTGTGAYALAAALAGSRHLHRRRWAGLLGMLFTVVLGNLGEVKLLFDGLRELGNVSFESLIPGYPALVSALKGLWLMLTEGQKFAFRPEWWYWNATRVVKPVDVYDPGVINEFPAFTFLYSDLHAHAMALPLTEVALALVLQTALGGWRPFTGLGESLCRFGRWCGLNKVSFLAKVKALWPPHVGEAWLPAPQAALPLAMLVIGALRATNTWDYPTYLGLLMLAPFLRLLHGGGQDKELWRTVSGRALVATLLVFLGAEVLFRPFSAHYVTAYSRFTAWTGPKTPLGAYLIMHGQFLFPLAVMALSRLVSVLRRLPAGQRRDGALAIGALAFGTLALKLVLVKVLEVAVAWVAVPLGVIVALLLLDTQTALRERVLWLWTGTALALTLLVELVVLSGDVGRMNTVFKFYLQVWMLLALSAAVIVERFFAAVLTSPDETEPSDELYQLMVRNPYSLGDGVLAGMMVLLFAGLLYPSLAIPARVRDRWNPDAPKTLDGMVYMDFVTHYERDTAIPLAADAGVIRWLQEHVEGSPVILEGLSDIEYQWGNRISIYTGLPSVVGWRWHQVQQRAVMPGGTVELRQQDVRTFYTTPYEDEAYEILKRYGVRYVVFTPFERAYANFDGELKFDTMVRLGWLRVVYEDTTHHARIYEVIP